MRNALVIVIVCLSVSLLYDVYKEPIDRLLHLDQTETNETTETGNRKQKTKKQAQKPDGQQEEGLPSAYDGRMTGKAPEVKIKVRLGLAGQLLLRLPWNHGCCRRRISFFRRITFPHRTAMQSVRKREEPTTLRSPI